MDPDKVISLQSYIEEGIEKVNQSLPFYFGLAGKSYFLEVWSYGQKGTSEEIIALDIGLRTKRKNLLERDVLKEDPLFSIDTFFTAPKFSFNQEKYSESPISYKKIRMLAPLINKLHEFSTKVISISGLKNVLEKFDTQNS